MDTPEAPKKKWYRTWWAYGLYVLFAVSVVVASVDDSKGAPQPVATNPAPAISSEAKQVTPAAPVPDKKSAQQELDKFMALAKQADLVTSYEFSDSAAVVYVGSAWYTMTVVQKKDFIAHVGELKKAVTGYRHFEVHDAYSDEKVAEVTSFSGSYEVYK